MNKLVTALLASALLAPIHVLAENVTPLNVEEKIEVDAPASAVWFNLQNFGSMDAWHPAVKKTEIIEGHNNKAGAVRQLTLHNGGTIKEKLLEYKFKEKTFAYAIIEGVLPVSHYVSTLTVTEVQDGKSLVVWKGDFKRKDLSDKPAAGQSDDDAINAVTSVYKGGLENLKKISEGG